MNNTFETDVLKGLKASQKYLQSKYFYDEQGSLIFREIMQMNTYYLTACELEIFKIRAKEIFEATQFKHPFNIVELGAGDGTKTAEFIAYLLNQNIDFVYQPIDISEESNKHLEEKMKKKFPTLKMKAQTGDYFEILQNIKSDKKPKLILFIGSNLGNYQGDEAEKLFRLLFELMNTQDKLLIGVDLKKNPNIIQNAYADPEGITKRFNLNLLNRINNELGSNFNFSQFDFFSYYNPLNGHVKSFLVSLIEQEVWFPNQELTISFREGETIWTELSKKYTLDELRMLLEKTGYRFIQHFQDSKRYFTDSLFEKK